MRHTTNQRRADGLHATARVKLESSARATACPELVAAARATASSAKLVAAARSARVTGAGRAGERGYVVPQLWRECAAR